MATVVNDDDGPGLASSAAEQAHRYSGAVGIGPASDTVELDHGHDICVTYCLTPGQRRRGVRCPSCFQGVEIRPLDGSEVEPGPTHTERFMAWVGGWAGAFCEAIMYPFRVGRAHTEALVRDILQQAMEAGLSAEIDGLTDILAVLEGIEGELRAIRTATDAAME